MDKFETLKEDMAASSANFSNWQMETDTSKAEIMTLETQITSMQHHIIASKKMQIKIRDDKNRIIKQIKTMEGLKKALTVQVAATKWSVSLLPNHIEKFKMLSII